jgi:hypothetical protein
VATGRPRGLAFSRACGRRIKSGRNPAETYDLVVGKTGVVAHALVTAPSSDRHIFGPERLAYAQLLVAVADDGERRPPEALVAPEVMVQWLNSNRGHVDTSACACPWKKKNPPSGCPAGPGIDDDWTTEFAKDPSRPRPGGRYTTPDRRTAHRTLCRSAPDGRSGAMRRTFVPRYRRCRSPATVNRVIRASGITRGPVDLSLKRWIERPDDTAREVDGRRSRTAGAMNLD